MGSLVLSDITCWHCWFRVLHDLHLLTVTAYWNDISIYKECSRKVVSLQVTLLCFRSGFLGYCVVSCMGASVNNMYIAMAVLATSLQTVVILDRMYA